jgi:hypothetical protein
MIKILERYLLVYVGIKVILSLKSTTILSLSFILLGAMVVSGLKTTTLVSKSSGGGAAVVEATKFPLKLMMILNKTAFEINETVGIAFFLENIGNETFYLSLYEDYFSFVVYDEAGSEVYNWKKNYVHLTIYIPASLPPDLSRSGALRWYQDYNPKLITLDPHTLFEYRKVAPGRYQIVGQFLDNSKSIVETPIVTITIGL